MVLAGLSWRSDLSRESREGNALLMEVRWFVNAYVAVHSAWMVCQQHPAKATFGDGYAAACI
jgi:hypothetical protein